MHTLAYRFKYNIESIEKMLPWERDIEVSMIISDLTKEIQERNKEQHYG
jgi:hypothetical protein